MENKENMSGRIPVATSEITKATEIYNFSRIVAGKELSPFNLIRFIIYPGEQSILDKHAVKEYWCIVKGVGVLKINGEENFVKEGELYFFESYVTHEIKNTSSVENLEIISVWW